MAGTASLAGLGAFMTGMALSDTSNAGVVQAFGSTGGAVPVEASSSSASMGLPTDQASRGDRGDLPATSSQAARPWNDGAVTTSADDELPGVPYGYQPYGYRPYGPSDLGSDSWETPYGPLAPPPLTDGIDDGTAPVSGQVAAPSSAFAAAPPVAPSWLAEPTWVPEPSSKPSTTPVTPPESMPPAASTPPAGSTRDTPLPAPPAPSASPSQPAAPAPGPSGTSLPFEPILDEVIGGMEVFQPAAAPAAQPSSKEKPPAANPPAAWPHD